MTYFIGAHWGVCDGVEIENGCCVGVKRKEGRKEGGREGGREGGEKFSDIYTCRDVNII